MATLESCRYLSRTSDGSYRLSKKMFGLRVDTATQEQLLRAARPVMEKLVAFCKETLNLGVLDGGEVVVIETMESPQAVRMSSKIGNCRYPHSTALGKVLLAGLPERDVIGHRTSPEDAAIHTRYDHQRTSAPDRIGARAPAGHCQPIGLRCDRRRPLSTPIRTYPLACSRGSVSEP